ncbi:hypothetical protein [Novipirellula maiorica]|uniref:hypothetical protein n=1 Tax=Novipirellula maiorica TaxID=1265734 RepID=UPI001181870C|nr:hypothetical protein [Rhodopirellula maiorica]
MSNLFRSGLDTSVVAELTRLNERLTELSPLDRCEATTYGFQTHRCLFDVYAAAVGLRKLENPHDELFSDLEAGLERAIDRLANELQNGQTGTEQIVPSAIRVRQPNDNNTALKTAFWNLFGTYHQSLGFWAAWALIKDHDSPLLEVDGRATFPDDSHKRLHSETATLFARSKTINDRPSGHVLWFEVELFDDCPGVLAPDLSYFGLTDISELLRPIAECWSASGLASDYRGIWRLRSDYPGDDDTFRTLNNGRIVPCHEGELTGHSLQAAVLAALWAAAGQVPMDDGSGGIQLHDNGGESFRLIPQIAVSARIDPSTIHRHNTSISLNTITDESVDRKVNALNIYGDRSTADGSIFDTALVYAEQDALNELSERFPSESVADRNYLGIRIDSSVRTMDDVMNRMLEVNTWTRALHESVQEEWLKKWGYARNREGQFLAKESTIADEIPLRFKDAEGRWNSQYKDCVIALNDERQTVTLELSSDDESLRQTLDDDLADDLREEVERQIQAGGINTGSLAYMQNPVGGAVEEARDIEALTAAEEETDDVMGGEP